MQWNLHLIISFYNDLHRLMYNEIVAINKKIEVTEDEERKLDIGHRIHFYTGVFEQKLRVNTFLMIYSHLEEFLYHVWQQWAKDIQLERKSSLKRFKPVVQNVLAIGLGGNDDWQFICACEEIRDCLLHANGRIDLLAENRKVAVETIIARYGDLLKVRTEHLEITGHFLDKFNKVVKSFSTKIESRTPAVEVLSRS